MKSQSLTKTLFRSIVFFGILPICFWSCSPKEDADPTPTKPVTQVDIPVIDGKIEAFLASYKIPGASLAISKNGKLVYKKGYGKADVEGNVDMTTNHRMRVASVSKTFTGIAIMRLVQAGKLSLDDKVFGADGILGTTYGTKAYNDRVKNAVDQLKQELPSFAIRERSYFNEKDSCILMEGGRFYGMGYVATEFDFSAKDELRNQLQEYPEYDFVRNIIKRYALEQPDKVVWL